MQSYVVRLAASENKPTVNEYTWLATKVPIELWTAVYTSILTASLSYTGSVFSSPFVRLFLLLVSGTVRRIQTTRDDVYEYHPTNIVINTLPTFLQFLQVKL